MEFGFGSSGPAATEVEEGRFNGDGAGLFLIDPWLLVGIIS